MNEERYVFEDLEVKKTGRVARKTLKAGGMVLEVVEITPANPDDGTWRKWLDPKVLFTIVQDE